jgi:hypothetical protein
MQRRVFFGKTLAQFADTKEAGFALSFPAIVLAAITIGAGVFFPYVLNNFIIPIKAILG